MLLLFRLIALLLVILAPFVASLKPHLLLAWFCLPACIIPLGIVWAITASKTSCRICGMRPLIHQPCSKHPNAPRLLLLGYHGTAAFHSLTRNRVCCPYCGTTNLVTKKDRD